MPEKIKITKKEIDEIYDIEDDQKVENLEVTKNAEYEEFTEYYDEKQLKERRENA